MWPLIAGMAKPITLSHQVRSGGWESMISANGGLPAHRYTPQVTQRWPRGSEPASQIFTKNKEALCNKCALYIPNDTGEYGIPTDASDFGVGGVLEQQLLDGRWAPCALYSKQNDLVWS